MTAHVMFIGHPDKLYQYKTGDLDLKIGDEVWCPVAHPDHGSTLAIARVLRLTWWRTWLLPMSTIQGKVMR